jgi:hypothetical protein
MPEWEIVMDTEPSLWARIYEFILAFGPYWWALAAGGIFALEPMMESYLRPEHKAWLDTHWSKETRQRHFRWASIAAVLIASFFAFDDINTKSKVTHKTDLDVIGKVTGERDEARRQRDSNISPLQQSTIDRLSGDLTAARGKVDAQEKLIEAQQSQIASQNSEIQKLKPKPARHLTGDDKTRLGAAFSKIKVDYPTLSISAPSEGEAQGFAHELMTFFNGIGIRVDRVGILVALTAETAPLQILIKDFSKVPPKAEQFARAMVEANFPVIGGKIESIGDDEFILVVASQH